MSNAPFKPPEQAALLYDIDQLPNDQPTEELLQQFVAWAAPIIARVATTRLLENVNARSHLYQDQH